MYISEKNQLSMCIVDWSYFDRLERFCQYSSNLFFSGKWRDFNVVFALKQNVSVSSSCGGGVELQRENLVFPRVSKASCKLSDDMISKFRLWSCRLRLV